MGGRDQIGSPNRMGPVDKAPEAAYVPVADIPETPVANLCDPTKQSSFPVPKEPKTTFPWPKDSRRYKVFERGEVGRQGDRALPMLDEVPVRAVWLH